MNLFQKIWQRKWFKRMTWILLFCLLSSPFVLYYFIPRALIYTRVTPVPLIFKEDFQDSLPKWFVKSKDSLDLKALLYPSDSSHKTIIIMVHGIRASKELYAKKALEMSKLGYNILTPDMRAHGESGGDYCTFGVKEKYDLQLWVDTIKKVFPDYKIGIWGQSLGAAAALQTMAIDPRIDFGIIESTFSELNLVGPEYLKRWTGINSSFLVNMLKKRTEDIGEFNFNEACPKCACELIEKPIFMAHGEEDKFILPYHGQTNFKHLKSKAKQWISVPGAHHIDLWKVGGEEYFNKVLAFISSNEK